MAPITTLLTMALSVSHTIIDQASVLPTTATVTYTPITQPSQLPSTTTAIHPVIPRNSIHSSKPGYIYKTIWVPNPSIINDLPLLGYTSWIAKRSSIAEPTETPVAFSFPAPFMPGPVLFPSISTPSQESPTTEPKLEPTGLFPFARIPTNHTVSKEAFPSFPTPPGFKLPPISHPVNKSGFPCFPTPSGFKVTGPSGSPIIIIDQPVNRTGSPSFPRPPGLSPVGPVGMNIDEYIRPPHAPPAYPIHGPLRPPPELGAGMNAIDVPSHGRPELLRPPRPSISHLSPALPHSTFGPKYRNRTAPTSESKSEPKTFLQVRDLASVKASSGIKDSYPILANFADSDSTCAHNFTTYDILNTNGCFSLTKYRRDIFGIRWGTGIHELPCGLMIFEGAHCNGNHIWNWMPTGKDSEEEDCQSQMAYGGNWGSVRPARTCPPPKVRTGTVGDDDGDGEGEGDGDDGGVVH